MPKTKPHNTAYTILHNWKLRLLDPDYNRHLKPEVVEKVINAISQWAMYERQNLKRLDNLVCLLEDVYKLASVKGLGNIDWILELRQDFIYKCLRYFDRRLQYLMDNVAVKRKKDNKVVVVSPAHLKKYEERIKIYKIWLQYPLNVDTAESK